MFGLFSPDSSYSRSLLYANIAAFSLTPLVSQLSFMFGGRIPSLSQARQMAYRSVRNFGITDCLAFRPDQLKKTPLPL